MSLALKQPLHLEIGDVTPIDDYLGGYEPSAHILDDFYQNKVGFIIALNFPSYSLHEKRDLGDQAIMLGASFSKHKYLIA
jgi:hypothetical protein